MAFLKVASLILLLGSAIARPQIGLDVDELSDAELALQMFDPNPQYTYAYQVAAEPQQTYIAHQESRDGAAVSGEYSYVDPLGSLITVTYTAGPMGYQEERSVQQNFVAIRAKPITTQIVSAAPSVSKVEEVVQLVRPAVQATVQQTAGTSDADLIARIISQLTPFIRESVTTSLGGQSSSTSTTTTVVEQAEPVVNVITTEEIVQPQVLTTTTLTGAPVASSATASIFGTGGANNVRVETPEFNFAYDLEK